MIIATLTNITILPHYYASVLSSLNITIKKQKYISDQFPDSNSAI